MVEVSVVKQKLQDYIVNQIDVLGESNPAIKLVKPLAKRAIINNIDSFDKFINAIAKDGKIDIEGIVDEEIEIIKSIPNFDFSIPVLGNGNISNGNITISIPFINKGIMFNQSDLETFRQLLTKKYIGEKYDMQKAHEVCNKFKDKLEEDIEVADVYVAINAQYHDYCKLFEKWFGKGNFDDMIFESAIDFWFDDVDFGEDKLWKYFNELK